MDGAFAAVALDRPQRRRKKVVFARINARDVTAQRYGGCEHEREDNRNLRPADECHGFTFKFEKF